MAHAAPRVRLASDPDWDPVESATADYHAQWQAYRMRWWLAAFLWVAWLPVCAGLFLLSRFYIHLPLTMIVLMLAWGAGAIGAVWWQGEFRCPRCRRRYGALGSKKGDTNYARGFFDAICANCKLRKFERAVSSS